MDLSSDLVSQFVKVTKDEVETKNESTVYGTIVVSDDQTFVKIDGSELLTPVSTTADTSNGDRVTVMIKDHSATVTGNLTVPSAGTKEVREIGNKVTDVEILLADKVDTVILEAEIANIDKLYAKKAQVEDLEAKNATITGKLNANEARIETLEADTIKVNDIEGEEGKFKHLTVDNLDAAYAKIDMANVNNAWIQNGVIKDAAISDEKVISVSANKLTAGEIDASKIIVTNLNADNITVGTINGQRIGKESISLDKLTEEVPTKEYLNSVQENLQGQIDGAIETWTSDEAPTLNNYPAINWAVDGDPVATAKEYKKHVGDVLYVVNAASSADGYCYRFTENTDNTYSWTLIKDSDVTAALQRLIDAEGDISGLKTFETTTSKWINETDEALKTTYVTTTKLEDELGNYVNSSTFNEKVESAVENSATITNLTEKMDIDPETGEAFTTLRNSVNEVKQSTDVNLSKISSLEKTVNGDGETVGLVSRTNTLEQTADSLSSQITTLEEDANGKLTALKTSVTQNTNAIELKASKAEAQEYANSALEGAKTYVDSQGYLTVSSDAIKSKVSKGSVISEINQSSEDITIDASRINLNGYATFTDTMTGYGKAVDLTSLDASTYYPVVMTDSIPLDMGLCKYACIVNLDSGSAPSWSTHSNGFTVNMTAYYKGDGWGRTDGVQYVTESSYSWCDRLPAYAMQQCRYSSRVIFFLRGGGRYYMYAPTDGNWNIVTSTTDLGYSSYPWYVSPVSDPSTLTSPQTYNQSAVLKLSRGNYSVSEWTTSGSTTIDGGKITTGSITADKIDVNDLFAQNVTATGNIQFKNKNRYNITADDSGNMNIRSHNDLAITGGGHVDISNEVGYIRISTPGHITLESLVDDGVKVSYKNVDYTVLNTHNTSDYVVAKGKSGDWYYRKWNSGLAECWYAKYQSLAMTTAYNGWYYFSFSLWLPFTMYVKYANIGCACVGGLYGSTVYSFSTTKVGGFVWSPISVTKDGDLFAYVFGTWK